jgi:flavin-dependent dehydrogenase
MTNTERYDVAIAGGGLAGLTLAIQCADAGYKTLLVEKEQYPFHKVCGEYISMESFSFLERLGLPLQQMQLPVINTLNISDGKGRLYNFKLPLGGFGVSRYMLDNALYNIAKTKGVNVLTQTKASDISFGNEQFNIQTNKESFTATCAVGSFGKRSNLDVKWKRLFIKSKAQGLNNYIGVKYHIRYPQPAGTIALHNFSNGYCGISGIEEDKCCLCYLTTAANLQQNGNSIKQMERQVLMKNPQLHQIFSTAEFLYSDPLTISQISFSKKTQVQNHVLLAGDAAGMITPLCGNGMSMAMHAGKLAFLNMQQFLQGNISRQVMEERYTTQWQQQFSRRLFTGRLVQRLFGNNTTTALFLQLVSKNAWFAQKLISSSHGTTF